MIDLVPIESLDETFFINPALVLFIKENKSRTVNEEDVTVTISFNLRGQHHDCPVYIETKMPLQDVIERLTKPKIDVASTPQIPTNAVHLRYDYRKAQREGIMTEPVPRVKKWASKNGATIHEVRVDAVEQVAYFWMTFEFSTTKLCDFLEVIE